MSRVWESKLDKEKIQQQAFSDFVNRLTLLSPDERVEVISWVGDCYCLHCGYPAPPDGHCTNDE